MNVSLSQDSSGPIVRLELPNDWPEFEVKNEFSDTTETCFVRLAAQFAASELDLSGYMDGVLSHLQKNGPRHKWDVPVKNGMANFMELDLFAGAVKRWFLEPNFVPLEKEGELWSLVEPSCVKTELTLFAVYRHIQVQRIGHPRVDG